MAALFAPCQAFDTAAGHAVTEDQAVKMGLLTRATRLLTRHRKASLDTSDNGVTQTKVSTCDLGKPPLRLTPANLGVVPHL